MTLVVEVFCCIVCLVQKAEMLVCVCFACNAAAAAYATIAAAMDLFVLFCSSVLHWLSCVWFVFGLFV